MLLYERWRQMARAGHDQIALHDLASGRRWSFRELDAAAERDSNGKDCVAFPQGASADFVLTVLRAWRTGQVVCPLEPGQTRPELAAALPPKTAQLKSTSATTGASRVVAFTAEQLAADADNIVATMGLRADWPNVGVISLAHSYGFSNLVLPLLLHGIPLILADGSLPEALRRAAGQAQFVTVAAVPALWRAWHDADSIPRNTRLAISAGAPLPLALEQGIFAMSGLKIHNFYGASECGGIAFDATSGPRTDAACAGGALKGVQVNVADDGCLAVRSRAVGESYWPEPDPQLGGGVFRTSDLAEISYGYIYLRGRAGDQINVAGRKVSPEGIEKALLGHPEVRECLVFGVPSEDAQRGENIVACVAAPALEGGETLRQFLLSRLPAWQVPRDWWFVQTLETNQRGKLSRADWRKKYLAR
jgi:long-chain acyl-CoA synthetase